MMQFAFPFYIKSHRLNCINLSNNNLCIPCRQVRLIITVLLSVLIRELYSRIKHDDQIMQKIIRVEQKKFKSKLTAKDLPQQYIKSTFFTSQIKPCCTAVYSPWLFYCLWAVSKQVHSSISTLCTGNILDQIINFSSQAVIATVEYYHKIYGIVSERMSSLQERKP